MYTALNEHIKRVRQILSKDLNERDIIDQVVVSTATLLKEPISLGSDHLKTPAEGYGRNLLNQDPIFGFVVVAMVWPPKEGTPIHDHGTWGVVGVADGMLNVTNYIRHDDGSQPGNASLTQLGTISARARDLTHVMPPDEDIHKVWNSTNEKSISIHTYGKTIDHINVFDIKANSVEQIELSYDNL
jgi:predicted metal-dependent enzyme (double-stranded beta helix superfamily)